MENSIKEHIRIAGSEGYAKRLDIMSEHIEQVVNDPLIRYDIRSVLDDVNKVLSLLARDIRDKRIK